MTFPAQTLWPIPIPTCLRHFPLSPLSLPHLLALQIPLAHPCTHPIQNTAPLSLEISTALKTYYISKTSKCLISLNFLEKKKRGAKCNNFQRNKKKFQENPSLENLEALNCLETQFQGFQGAKSSFQAF